MPLEEERQAVARELAELNSLAADLKKRDDDDKSTAPKSVAFGAAHEPEPVPPDPRKPRILFVSYQKVEPAGTTPKSSDGKIDPLHSVTALDHYFRGEAYRRQAARSKDVESVKDAWKRDPELMEKAIAEYRKALVLNPEHYWSHYQIGRCYLSMGRTTESLEALGTCIALRPESAWGYSARGMAHLQQKRFADAERDLNDAIQLNPSSRAARLNRGVLYSRQQKYEQAIADFMAVLAPPREQRLIEAAYYLGMIRAQLGDNKSALKEFDAVIEENPRFQQAYYYRAQVHFANDREDLGLQDLDSYIDGGRKTELERWVRHHLHGRLLRAIHAELPPAKRKEKWGQSLVTLAVSELRQSIQLGGQAWEIFDDLGAMLEHMGKADEAIAAYSKGVAFAPLSVKLRNKRGWAYEGFGRHNEALADFAAAAKANPENGEAHTGLGYVRALLKQVSDAQREADLALVHGADEFLVLHNVACIYATLSEGLGNAAPRYQEVAIAVLKRAIAKWKTPETPLNEIDLIKAEPAFKSLRGRADFQALIAPEGEH